MKNKSVSNSKQDTMLFANGDQVSQFEVPITFSVMMCEETAELSTVAVIEVGMNDVFSEQARNLLLKNKKFFWLGIL